MINAATHPHLRAWLPTNTDTDFPIQNMPFGVMRTQEKAPRLASILGDTVIDLGAMADLGYFADLQADASVFHQAVLNPFIALGKVKTSAIRHRLIELFSEGEAKLRENMQARQQVLHPVREVELLLPLQIGDYTDFYSSREHATNVGIMFRDPTNALLPNWLHLPVGYHGRSSSIVVSGTPLYRPKGQTRPNEAEPPVYGASKQVDFELEMAFVIGQNSELGHRIPLEKAEEFIFGLALFNDWSARDLQKWEYVPLGPFLGKNFGSTLSPWIVTLEALEPFRVAGPVQEPQPLSYLQQGDKAYNFDLNLEVLIEPQGGSATTVAKSNFKYMYWSMVQQLTHHTVNGCNVRIGDLCASGTISGPTPDSYGSMLEIAWKGTKPVPMPDGTARKFILDHDAVILRGYGEYAGIRVGFGEAKGQILPALAD